MSVNLNCSCCGGPLVSGSRFCSQCGTVVGSDASPAADPLRGLLDAALGTHYEIHRELGRGGMGAVFLAHEKGLDRDVAIKVLPPDRAESEAVQNRFRLEARAAARLSHANIVPLHTFGEHDGMLYYVMGFVEGESLAERLSRLGHVGEREARRILAALADALHYAHSRGVLHRDVKPQNILIEAGSARPLLTDFGISRLTNEGAGQTSAGMIIGTPEYMSPEQASGDPDIDGRSDVYSLGLVGYAMLSGRLPFQGRTPGELIAKRLVETAPRLISSDTSVSADLIDLVMKCLARDPGDRWPDCQSFSHALAIETEPEADLFESAGLVALAFAYAGVLAFTGWRTAQSPSVFLELAGKITPTLAALIGAIAIGGGVDLWRRGRSVRQALQILFLEPAWWTTWFPSSLRRPGNVWPRLPWPIRALRAMVGLVFVGVALGIGPLLFVILPQPESSLRRTLAGAIGVFYMGAVFGPSLVCAWVIPWRLQHMGLSQREAGGVAYQASLSRRAFWSRPAVSAWLARYVSLPATVAPGETKTADAAAAPTRVD